MNEATTTTTTSSSSSSSSSSEAPIHVLAIDDSPVDRRVVEKLLKAAMFKVTMVESGKKAIEALGLNEEEDEVETLNNGLKFDIILTDYCMPEMNGYDILKVVKEHSHLKSMPVVIMSSEHDPQRISRCLDTGAQDFIRKPLQLRDMANLRSYVNSKLPIAKTGTKRKAQLDLIPDSKEAERRPHITSVTVA
ncbi:hypothetical protein Sjap_018900 [Stephania japonica]|uniref:Response regulatory domain-containing protein n=1 Tax=Stephania japonica TaxID=461633 RepID=A0AAP0I8Y1_9MAGN